MTVHEKEIKSTKKRKENYIEVKKPKVEYKENFKVSTKCQAFYNYGKVQFTGDGESILSVCDGHLKCFQLSSGNTSDAVERFEGEEIISFLLANDNNTLITAARNGIMRHWNLSTKSLEKTWKSVHVGIVTCMVFDETVTLLATGGSDSTIKVWDIIQRYHTHNLKGGKGVFSKICFVPMGEQHLHVFGAADDYNIHVWNLHRNEHIASLAGHYSTVTDFVFIQQNKQMLSCARDKVVLVWDLATFKLLKTIPIFEAIEACILVPEQFSVPNLTLNDQDTYFMTAGEKGILKVWSTSSACCVYQHAIVPQESKQDMSLILDVVHVPSLNAIGITTYEQNILLHSSKDLSLINQFVGCNDDILSIKYVGADERHIAVATNSPFIKVFQLPSFSCRLLKGHHDIVICLDVFPRHKNILVSGSKDNNVRVWDLGTDLSSIKCLYTGYGHTSSITDVCCCRGKSRFFASASEDMTLKLWEVPEGKTSSDAAVKPLISPYITVKAHDKLINSLDISQNDKLIASGSQDHTAKIWDASDLSLRGVMRGHKRGVWCVKFSPVDLALATSSSDGTIRIWSLVDFSSLKVFQGHEASVLQVDFLSSGTQLISSAGDGNIHLWDIKDSMCIRTLAEHDHKVWTLAVSASEQQVISGGADSNIIVWNDVTQTEKQEKFLNREQLIVQEQELSNLVHEGKWIKALGLALTLNKPFASFEIIQQIRHKHDEATFVGILHEMRQDQKEILLKFSLEWLTNSKTYYPAVIIFDYFYKHYDSEELLKIPDMTTYIQEALPYLDRHSKRIERLSQDMQILNFLEKQMAPE